MGKPFEKQTRFFALLSPLSFQIKGPNSRCGLQTLAAIAAACDGLESIRLDTVGDRLAPVACRQAALDVV